MKAIFVEWIPSPMEETLQAQPGSCHPGTPHLVILADVTTMDRQALPVALCQSESKTTIVLVGKAVSITFFLVAFSLEQI